MPPETEAEIERPEGEPEAPARQPRAPRQDTATEGPTPEEALADAQRKITEGEEARRQAERRAEAERRRADEATNEAQRARADVGTAREASLTSAIETAKGKRQRAQQALRVARDAGDWDAHDQANSDLADAAAEVSLLAAQKQQFDAWKAQRPAPQPQQRQAGETTYSPQAQQWIVEHPKFNSDRQYKAVAMGAHTAALEDGIAEGSAAYFRFLTETVDRFFPAEDGMNNQRVAPRPPASSTAAPPSRAATNGGGRRVAADPAAVARAMGLSNADDLREGARICGMSLDEYVKDQARILNERANGEDTGLRYTGEGSFR